MSATAGAVKSAKSIEYLISPTKRHLIKVVTSQSTPEMIRLFSMTLDVYLRGSTSFNLHLASCCGILCGFNSAVCGVAGVVPCSRSRH